MKPIDRMIEIIDELEGIREGYNSFNMADIADWLNYEAKELPALAQDVRNELEQLKTEVVK